MSSRQYDLVVFGATGYTGKLTAEHITKSLPTDLKWAIAGRSEEKLEAIAAGLKALHQDRIQPGIEVCALNDADLSRLAKKTTVLIATVGPYALHGEYAFKACAQNGTHYLDVTGEVPWVFNMIKKYETEAKNSGAIMIPQIGIESSPPDVITYTLVNLIKEKFSAPTAEVVVSVHDTTGRPSGGTLATVLSFFDNFNLKQIGAAMAPYALSPIPGPVTKDPTTIITKVLGVRSVRDLGILTTALQGGTDTAIVHRSWGLLNYGPKFRFHEYQKARNHLTAVLLHFALILAGLFLATPPLRNLAKKYVYQPGDGPTEEDWKNDRFEYRAIAYPDVSTKAKERAFCKASFEGSLYVFTGISLAEAAISILRDEHKLSGGVYTPASLGEKYIGRLQGAGFKMETKIYDD